MANLRTNNLSGEQGQNAYRGSVFFDGSSSFLSFNAAIWNSQASDSCTFECWLWVADFSTARNIFDLGSTGDFSIQSDGQIRVHPVASNHMDTNNSITTQSWHHIALVQESGRKDVYINGVKSSMTVGGGDPVASNWANTNANTFNLGDDGVYRDFYRGYMSNVRVIKGVALYDDDFTPPFTELKATDSNTSLLCCQNSDDVTQEETGKTITGNGSLATAGYNKTQPKVIPPYGVDAGNTFGGPIQQSSQGYMYFPTGRTEERVIVNNNFGARGLIMGGITYPGTTYVNVIESIQIASLGNSVDFGDLTNKPNGGGGFSSKIRGFVVGGNTPEGYGINVIQFVTIATASNATDFGDAGYSRANARGVSNNTRGVYSGGESASSPNPSLNNIEFVTMSTSGNGQDFGDLVDAGSSYATASSPTRGVNMGGYRDGEVNFIDFITIATTGNSQDFGDLINTARNGNGGVSNGHRGIVMGGYASPARTNVIQYVTIQSTGNAIDFGDLTDARDPAVTSSLTRGIACTGDYPSNVNIIDFIEIMTTANAVDFGDMLTKTSSAQTCSNAHGGLADDM